MSTPSSLYTPPLYLPFIKHPELVSMATAPLNMRQWIEPDQYFEHYYKNKIAQQNTASQRVYCVLEESKTAQEELRDRLLTHLTQEFPNLYQLDANNTLHHHGQSQIEASQASFWHTSLWVQEDLCILQEVDNEYCLTAASLCSPSEWDLREKIGQPITAIHAPVPRLNQNIGKQIHHLINKLSPLRPYQRFNWSLKDSNQLALHPDREHAASDSLYVRVERQTLTRLPKTNAIAFTIKIYIYPLEQLAAIEGVLPALKQAIEAFTADEVQYKSMQRIYPLFRKQYKSLLDRSPNGDVPRN